MKETGMDYNPIAKKYDSFEQDATTLWLLGYPSVIKYLEPVTNKQILDYGCGSGTFSRYLHDRGAKVTGVDVSETMIEVARSNDPENISYHSISSGEIGFLRDRSFDHVVSNFVFCTITTLHEIRTIMLEIHRILKENGMFIIMNSNWERSNGREFISYKLELCKNLIPGQRINAILKNDPPIIFEDYFWSRKDYMQILKECGFSIQTIQEPTAEAGQAPWIDEITHPPFIIIVAKKNL
jgi:ubiquinone/menaquinone biosynthesis C-methylase UbiE